MLVQFRDVTHYEVVKHYDNSVHPFWFVFWLFMFFPVILLVFITNYNSVDTWDVKVVAKGKTHTLNLQIHQIWELQDLDIECNGVVY